MAGEDGIFSGETSPLALKDYIDRGEAAAEDEDLSQVSDISVARRLEGGSESCESRGPPQGDARDISQSEHASIDVNVRPIFEGNGEGPRALFLNIYHFIRDPVEGVRSREALGLDEELPKVLSVESTRNKLIRLGRRATFLKPSEESLGIGGDCSHRLRPHVKLECVTWWIVGEAGTETSRLIDKVDSERRGGV